MAKDVTRICEDVTVCAGRKEKKNEVKKGTEKKRDVKEEG